jgi:hypothetical protein
MRPKYPNETFDEYLLYIEGYNEGFADGYNMTMDQLKYFDLVRQDLVRK